MAYESDFGPHTLAIVTTPVRDRVFFEFADGLADLDYELVASEGTAKALQAADIQAATFAEVIAAAEPNMPPLACESQGLFLAGQICDENSRLGEAIGIVCVDLNPNGFDVAGTALLNAAQRRNRLVLSRSSLYPDALARLQDGSAYSRMRIALGKTAAYDVAAYWADHSRIAD